MKTKHVFERVSQKASYDLPASLNREIGRVIVRWAHFESHMQAMIYAIAFDGAADKAALGRLAIRELKVGERADLLGQVADVQGVMLDNPDLSFLSDMRLHRLLGGAGTLRRAPARNPAPALYGGRLTSLVRDGY